jgi:DNA-binding NtrC family response regulator
MRVLVVDDEIEQRTLLQKVMEAWGHTVRTAVDGADAIKQLGEFAPAVMLTDLQMPGMSGFEMMERLRETGSLPPTIVLTAFGSLETALNTVHKYGGFWFLEKPIDLDALRALLLRAADHGRLARENERLRADLAQRGVLGDLVGSSHAMQHIFALIRQVAPTNACVLITGESGSGKELVARAIHQCSTRSGEPFIAINCAAMPETLMESEIFGHEKGAFTGAVERRAGALEMAEGGTLFLDEIAEMPLAMQAKLLRVLEDFHFRRLGGKQELSANVRLLSATNRDPQNAIHDGKLREDLYYRLNVFGIEIPPLRDRIEDVPMIVEAMIEKLNAKHGTRVTHLSPEAREALLAQRWDGNVRELRNVVERSTILAGEGPITKAHLSLAPRGVTAAQSAPAAGLNITVGMTVDEAERVLIEATLAQSRNNKTRAAGILGISAKTLHLKLRQYRMGNPDESDPLEKEQASA